MDDLDRRLLALFAHEPRIGVLQASRELGVARGTVQARLDKLVDLGVITGWGPELSPEALGPVTAFLTLEIRQEDAPLGGLRHRREAPGDHPRGARGAHDHRRRRPLGPGGRTLQLRPPAGHRPGPPGLERTRPAALPFG